MLFAEETGVGRPSSSRPELDIVTNDALLTPTPQEVSTAALLERAAALGPVRTAWESTYSPDDPILLEKMQEHVARRRERFQKIVKGTLAACLGVCIVALVVTAFTGEPEGAVISASGRSSPAMSITSIEKLDIAPRGKAQRVVPQPVVATWSARGYVKRR